ncbi:hypothetical protein [Aurantiacibacter spongiae]|uniref:hypothetical protein n=1 Tax=Aurantiacibacter spongiae TaxID=2488860 RepID=UPI0013159408|nr:hypothetical protein [Aurantiacibacter spongiae]
MPYIYIADESGEEIEGTRRQVDYDADRKHYLAVKADLESKMGEGCMVKDSELDG